MKKTFQLQFLIGTPKTQQQLPDNDNNKHKYKYNNHNNKHKYKYNNHNNSICICFIYTGRWAFQVQTDRCLGKVKWILVAPDDLISAHDSLLSLSATNIQQSLWTITEG